MQLDLPPVQARVLAALIEKESTTPDQYPLSTNALRSACNQKTSRDPVMDLSEREVDDAVLALRERGAVRSSKPSGSRAWKHRHVLDEVLPLDPGSRAVLAVLILRGRQTAGELRTRTERIHAFESIDEVDDALQRLHERDPSLVRNIGREPGQSQDRWEHLVSSGAETPETATRRLRTGRFSELHDDGLFVLPNAWDRGSARLLTELGFDAIATTSAGHGRAIGKDDQEVTRDELLAHVEDLSSFVDVPISVDSERLFGDDPGGVARTVQLLADAGAAGCSIEDWNPVSNGVDPIDRAADAVAAAAASCASTGLVLTARAENHLYGIDDLDDTIERLRRYRAAGADVVYAPGLLAADDIELVVDEVDAPVNVLGIPGTPPLNDLRDLGVRRVSTGSLLYSAAMKAARALAEQLR